MTRVLDVPASLTTAGLPERRLFTRAEYERVVALGLFEGERLELIGGEIVRKVTPQHSAHVAAIRRLEEALRIAFGTGFDIRIQFPLAVTEDSEPEPDVSVVRGSFKDYEHDHPKTAVLVVEVADSSLRFDRGAKGSLYAAAGIPEYWVVNLVERVVEIHLEPRADEGQPFRAGYGVVVTRREDESLVPSAVPSAIRVADLLPARR